MKNKNIALGLILFLTMPIYAISGYEVGNEETVIVRVYNSPVGIQSRSVSGGKKCKIYSSISSMKTSIVELGKTVKFHVIEDKDIIVMCNGEKGITISRD